MARSARRALSLLLAVVALALVASSALAQSSSSSSLSASSSSSSSVFRSSSSSSSAVAGSVSSTSSSTSTSSSSSSADASAALRSDTALGVFSGLNGDDISAGPGVLAAAGILLGATANIAGFRLFKPVVFLGALVAGGYLIARVVERAVREDNDYVVLCSWIAFGVGGLVAGGTAASIEKLGKLTVGVCAGVLFAGLLNVGIGHKIDADEPDRLLLVLQVVVGLVCALAALDTIFLILSLSFSGAFVLMYGIGYFAGSFPIGSDLAAYRNANRSEAWLSAVPVAWWIYLAVFLLVFGLGLYVQIAKAREHGYYDENSKFVYAAHSDDEPESSGHTINRSGAAAGGGDGDDNDRKSPNHANFQNFAPYQPPAYVTGYNQGSAAYPSSDISYGHGASSGASASNYGNSRSSNNNNTSNRSSRSGSRRPASTYSQPYTSYYTRPSATTASSQPSRGYQSYGQQRFTPTSPL